MKYIHTHAFAIFVLIIVLGCVGIGWQVRPTARDLAMYRPGDCVQSPVYQVAKLERWEEPPAPRDLVMITEVGDQAYRVRGWGGGAIQTNLVSSPERDQSYPHWYVEHGYETLNFAILDDPKRFMSVPCPEQGPEPEKIEQAELSTSGTVFYLTSGATSVISNNVIKAEQ